MPAVAGLNLWLAAGVLACGPLGCGSQVQAADVAAAPLTPVAHSALVTLEAGATPAGLILRVRHTANQTPLSVTGLSVSVDGKGETATARGDGSWLVPLTGPGTKTDARLEVVVAHDGIREVLSGRIAVSAADTPGAGARGSAAGMLRDHKQLAWWILNIAIVLIGVIAISRRLS